MRRTLDLRATGTATPRLPSYAARGHDWSRVEVTCCFVALVSLVASPIYGTVCAALFVAAVMGLIMVQPLQAGRDLIRFLPLLALPLLAMLSTLWSDAPERTLRAAIQILLTMAAAVLISRRIASDRLIIMLFVAVAGVCLLGTLDVGRAVSRHAPLVGLYASKNAMAYAAHLLIALALAVLFERRRAIWWRLLAMAIIPWALMLLYLAQSSGALAALMITLILFPAFLVIGRVSGGWRVVIVIAVVVGLAVALALLPEVEAAIADFRQNVLKKDASLTGRTYLWNFAFELAAKRPLFGYGYYAFWRQGNIDAEGLWRFAGIASRSGFNFHNSFIEMRVDMGWIGLIVLVMTCGSIAALAALRQLTRPSVSMAFLLALTLGELIRAFAETSLFGPFSYYTLLLVATGVYACDTAQQITGAGAGMRTAVAGPKRSTA